MEFSLSGGAFPYLEYAWLTAPNAAGQTINAQTLTTCTLDTEIRDTSSIGSITSNQVTIPSGTYLAKAFMSLYSSAGVGDTVFRLYDVTNTSALTGVHRVGNAASAMPIDFTLETQFTVSSSTVIRLEIETYNASTISVGSLALSSSTAGRSQRTTLKLWKLA